MPKPTRHLTAHLRTPPKPVILSGAPELVEGAESKDPGCRQSHECYLDLFNVDEKAANLIGQQPFVRSTHYCLPCALLRRRRRRLSQRLRRLRRLRRRQPRNMRLCQIRTLRRSLQVDAVAVQRRGKGSVPARHGRAHTLLSQRSNCSPLLPDCAPAAARSLLSKHQDDIFSARHPAMCTVIARTHCRIHRCAIIGHCELSIGHLHSQLFIKLL